MSKNKPFNRFRSNYLEDDQGRLYFFLDISTDESVLQLQKPTFPKNIETLNIISKNLIELLFMEIARKEESSESYKTQELFQTQTDFSSYNDVFINYDIPYLDVVKQDIRDNLLVAGPLKTPKTAWFCVKVDTSRIKTQQLDKNLISGSSNLPYPNSSSSKITFLKGKIQANCILATNASNAKTSIPLKSKTCKALLEFT